jgi:hypothetical protein
MKLEPAVLTNQRLSAAVGKVITKQVVLSTFRALLGMTIES